jgi:hypothetical protein
MLNTDAGALAVLTLLALGTFTAGLHIGAWRICLVGLIFGIGVPGIALLEQSALFLLLLALVLIAIAAPIFWRTRQRSKAEGQPHSPASTRQDAKTRTRIRNFRRCMRCWENFLRRGSFWSERATSSILA